jgi:hypothetical protein
MVAGGIAGTKRPREEDSSLSDAATTAVTASKGSAVDSEDVAIVFTGRGDQKPDEDGDDEIVLIVDKKPRVDTV